MDDGTKVFLGSLAVVAVFVIMAFGALAVEMLAQSGDAQACIEAGKEWIHVRGDIYECRAP